MLNGLKQRVWLDVWMEGSLRNRVAPVCDRESVCNAEEIVLFFFFFPVHVQCLCVEATTDFSLTNSKLRVVETVTD